MSTSVSYRRRRFTLALASGALLFGSTWAHAQSDDLTIEDLSLEEMLGVVEGVTRVEEPLARAPASVTIISADEIARSGARDVPELLRYVASVHVVSHTRDSHSVSIRGLQDESGADLVLLIDGHPFTNMFDGSPGWASLPITMDDIERIEIVRGPVSVVYGANASAGVINIVRKTDRESETSSYTLSGGFPEMYELRARLTRRVGIGSYKLSVRHASVSDRLPDPFEPSTMTAFDAAAQWNLGKSRRLAASAGSSVGTASAMSALFPALDELRVETVFQTASYTDDSALIDGDQLSVRQSFERQLVNPLVMSPAAELAEVHYHKLDTELGYRLTLTDWAQLGVTSSIAHAQVESPAIAGGHASLPMYAAGANATLHPGKRMDLRAGARVDYNGFVVDPRLSYRTSLTFSVTHDHLLRAAVGTAFRHPTFAEVIGRFEDPESGFLYLVGAGSRELRPPQVHTAEVGYRGQIASQLTADAAIYATRATSLIAQEHRSVPSTFVNSGAMLLGGAEAELRYRHGDVFTAVGYSFVHTFDAPSDAAAPEHMGYASVGGTWPARVTWDARASFVSAHLYDSLVGVPPSLLRIGIDPTLFASARVAYAVPGTRLTVALRAAGIPLLSARESPYSEAPERSAHGYATLQYDY